MPKLKLTYFDFHGGRGEPARLALSIGGIPFEDARVAPSDDDEASLRRIRLSSSPISQTRMIAQRSGGID